MDVEKDNVEPYGESPAFGPEPTSVSLCTDVASDAAPYAFAQ